MQALRRAARSLCRAEALRGYRPPAPPQWKPTPGFVDKQRPRHDEPKAPSEADGPPPPPLPPLAPMRLLATAGSVSFFDKPVGMESWIHPIGWEKKMFKKHRDFENEMRYVNLRATEMMGTTMHPINRLEGRTSGVIALSSAPRTAKALQHVWGDPSAVRRDYLVLVAGNPAADAWSNLQPLRQTLRQPDGIPRARLRRLGTRMPGTEQRPLQEARTDFSVLARFPATRGALPFASALVQATPFTGRYMQVYKHLKLDGHVVLGDWANGNARRNEAAKKAVGLQRCFTHAVSLSLDGAALPAVGRELGDDALQVISPLPMELRAVIERLPNWHAAVDTLRDRGLLGHYDDEVG